MNGYGIPFPENRICLKLHRVKFLDLFICGTIYENLPECFLEILKILS